MKSLGLLKDDAYTNLALILFDENPFAIKVAAFTGLSCTEFKDRREFTGSVFTQLEDAYDFIDRYNALHAYFNKLDRIDKRDYDESAIREALFSLVIHRDYTFSSSSLVKIFQDRIEFISLGGLCDGITKNDLMMEISVCRNKGLANVFYRLEYIEAYGTGIKKIMDAYKDEDMKPSFDITENVFKVTLPNRNIKREEKKNYDYDSVDLSTLSDEKVVLEVGKEKRFFTRKDIEDVLTLSSSSSIRLLKSMTENGKISRRNKGKRTVYYINK